jgi:predicted nucleic acid-binding protein
LLILDTNTVSELMRRDPQSSVIAWTRTTRHFANVVITLIDLWAA